MEMILRIGAMTLTIEVAFSISTNMAKDYLLLNETNILVGQLIL